MSRKQVHAELIRHCSPRILQDALRNSWRAMRSSFALSARVHQFASMTLTARQVSVGSTIWRPRSANARVTRSCRQAGKVSSAQKPDLGPQRCGRTTKQPRRRGRTSAPAACELALPTRCGHSVVAIRWQKAVIDQLPFAWVCKGNAQSFRWASRLRCKCRLPGCVRKSTAASFSKRQKVLTRGANGSVTARS